MKTRIYVAMTASLLVGAGLGVAEERAPYEPHEMLGATPCAGIMEQHRQTDWRSMPKETIEGRIHDVKIEEGCHGGRQVLQLKVKSAGDDFLVHIGPTRHINTTNFRFALGDDVKVSGVLYEGQGEGEKTIIASEIVWNGKTLTIRDDNGRPIWRRGGQPLPEWESPGRASTH